MHTLRAKCYLCREKAGSAAWVEYHIPKSEGEKKSKERNVSMRVFMLAIVWDDLISWHESVALKLHPKLPSLKMISLFTRWRVLAREDETALNRAVKILSELQGGEFSPRKIVQKKKRKKNSTATMERRDCPLLIHRFCTVSIQRSSAEPFYSSHFGELISTFCFRSPLKPDPLK